MKKRNIMTAIVLSAAMVAGCGSASTGTTSSASQAAASASTAATSTAAASAESTESAEPAVYAPENVTAPAEVNIDGALVASAGSAAFTEGSAVNFNNEEEATSYQEAYNLITCLGEGSEVTYTIPEGADGEYDLYLTISKVLAPYSAQFFTFRINDGEEFSVPTEVETSGDTFANTIKDADEYYTGTLYDSARFPITKSVSLKAGDTFTVTCKWAVRAPKLKGIAFPNLGDLLLAPAGSEVPTGYEDTIAEQQETDASDVLSGKKIIWLGSSVTYGAHSAGNYSMVDVERDLHPNLTCDKYAISSTTLVNDGRGSYVERLKLIPKTENPDLIVVQLSTNDATTGKEFGEISDSTSLEDFDDTTIAGAIESIIAYSRDTFNCPVVFYTGSYCEKENYKEMVDLLLQIQEKWGIGVIDLFNNEEMTAIYGSEQYNAYMSDQVHPTREGYIEWWGPVIDAGLVEYATENL